MYIGAEFHSPGLRQTCFALSYYLEFGFIYFSLGLRQTACGCWRTHTHISYYLEIKRIWDYNESPSFYGVVLNGIGNALFNLERSNATLPHCVVYRFIYIMKHGSEKVEPTCSTL